jgi:hypothetical protein
MPESQSFFGWIPIFFWRSCGTPPALPKAIGECGDILLRRIVIASFGAGRGPGLPVILLGEQVGLVGMLQRLSGTFMSRQVIFFSVVLGAGAMCVAGGVTLFIS